MSDLSQKLTLEQISKDVHAFAKQCDDRAVDDLAFQAESRETDISMKDTLTRIDKRLAGIETKLDPEHDDYILRETNQKMDQLWGLFQGLSFAGNAIKYTAGVVAGMSVIIVSLFALIRYVK